jgi:adenine-specific DNA-methyltransferase
MSKIHFKNKFPAPQYLGSKFIHLDWIMSHIPENISTVLDAFAGSQSVSYRFKQMGFETHTNDLMMFSHSIGKSLIENKNEILTSNDIEYLFSDNKKLKEGYSLIYDNFTDIFFESSESISLDCFKFNIDNSDFSEYKKELSHTILFRALTQKIIMGHFGHAQALNYAKNPERVRRNPTIARPIKDLFADLVNEYNNSIFDNKKNNKSYNESIIDLLPKLKNIDLVYFDPPYIGSHSDYQSFYHLLETFRRYWKDKDFINKIKRYEPKLKSGFETKRDAINSFNNLFENSKNIPYWILSYNDNSYPNKEVMFNLLSKYKEVKLETFYYKKGRGGKGSKKGSSELLFICSPKKK